MPMNRQSAQPSRPDAPVVAANEWYPNGLTEMGVWEYYQNTAARLADDLVTAPAVLVVLVPDRGGQVVLRKNPKTGQPFKLSTSEDVIALNNGRYVEFHRMVGHSTDRLWVDLDPKPDYPWESVVACAKSCADMMAGLTGADNVSVNFSGARGFHIYGQLGKPMDVDSARQVVEETLERDVVPNFPKTSVGQTSTPDSMRLDVSTLHNTGSLRAEWSLNSRTGLVCMNVDRVGGLEVAKKEMFTVQRAVALAAKGASMSAFNRVSYIVHMPGHKDSKGNPAPWVIKSHETDEIISSHPSQEKAKEHLRQMHAHAAKGFDGEVHKFSSTQVELPADLAVRLIHVGRMVAEEDLYNDPEDPTFGRETDAHITVQFGLHTDKSADVADLVRGFGLAHAHLTKIGMFPGKDSCPYDVLKFDVQSPDLHRLHRLLNSSLEVTDSFKQYKPHATIAYVIKGRGEKYVHGTEWATAAEKGLAGEEMIFHSLMFSGKTRTLTPVALAESWLSARTAASPLGDHQWSAIYNAVHEALTTAKAQATQMEGFLYEAGRILLALDEDLTDVREDDEAVRQVTQDAIAALRALSPALEPLIRPLADALGGGGGGPAQIGSSWVGEAVTAAPATPRVLIGVSGFNYKSWKGTYYPADLPGKQRLAYLAARFPTIEMSSTFHQMPDVRVLKGWDAKTPDGFIMAFRGLREVSHVRRLVDCGAIMADFCRRLEVLGDKLGPIGFQMPESARFDPVALSSFLESLPSGFKYALEFRSEPWYNRQTYDLLAEHDVALTTVSHSNMGIHPVFPATWSCFRMSGHNPDYRKNSYSKAELMNWRGIIAAAPAPAFVYFNNEFSGFSAKNAASLIDLMGLTVQSGGTLEGPSVGPASSGPSSLTTGPNNSQNVDAVDPDDVPGRGSKERGDTADKARPRPDDVPFFDKDAPE